MSPQDQHGSRGYSVPTGRPYALKELQASLGSLGDHQRELYDGAHPAEYDTIADALYVAFQTATGLAPAKSYTGCPEHPNGALDPEAPEGWGRCLICNDRRRLDSAARRPGRRPRRRAAPPRIPRTGPPVHARTAALLPAHRRGPAVPPEPVLARGGLRPHRRRPPPRLHRRPRTLPAPQRLGMRRTSRRADRPRRSSRRGLYLLRRTQKTRAALPADPGDAPAHPPGRAQAAAAPIRASAGLKTDGTADHPPCGP